MSDLTFSTTEIQNLLDDANDESSVSAYLSASSNTTMTNAMDWYAIGGTFVNDFKNFELDTDKIKYIGDRDYAFEIDWSAKLASDTVSATINITVSINGTPTEAVKMGAFAKTSGEPISFSGTEIVTLSPDDTIQLVMQTDKAGSVITVGQFVATATKFVIKRK